MSSSKSNGKRDAERGAGRTSPHVALSRTEANHAEESAAAQLRRRVSGRAAQDRSSGERAFLVGIESRSHRGRDQGSLTAQARISAQVARAKVADDHLPNSAGHFDAEESLAELRELATSAGATIAGEFLQHRDRPDPATLIGRGKLEELKAAVASSDSALVIFDHELSPSQQRNVENVVGARVIDRTQLILDIFARHAKTREGQLQVELAQLEYLLPRLAGRGAEMSQLGGGIGTRGPGETQLETDRRRIYRRIRFIQQQVENVRRSRAQQRQRRESVPVATVALVGYTNTGKSTLFNALTRAGVLESAKMFATLDPTIRGVTLPSKRKVLLSDTVGFIRHLPHALVTAFRATLEEVQRAALIIHVSDVTSPNLREQDVQVESVLHELDAHTKPRLHIFNKIDLLSSDERDARRNTVHEIYCSAAKGIGLDALLERIDEMIAVDPLSRVRLRVPQAEGKVLALLDARARVLSRRYRNGFVEMEAQAPESVLRDVQKYVRQ